MCFASNSEETDLVLVQRAITSVFNIQLSGSESILVQVKSEEWGGLFIDIGEKEKIADKSVLKAIICQVSVNYVR